LKTCFIKTPTGLVYKSIYVSSHSRWRTFCDLLPKFLDRFAESAKTWSPSFGLWRIAAPLDPRKSLSALEPYWKPKVNWLFNGLNNSGGNLQASLSEDGQEKIDEISGQPHEHDGTERVIEFAGGHVAIWIPESHLEWVLYAQITAHIHNPLPGTLLVLLHSYIINGYLNGSNELGNILFSIEKYLLVQHLLMLYSTVVVGYQNESIDGYVHWYDLRLEFPIANHRTYNSFTSANQYTCWSIHIVHPTGQRFRHSGRNCTSGINVSIATITIVRYYGKKVTRQYSKDRNNSLRCLKKT